MPWPFKPQILPPSPPPAALWHPVADIQRLERRIKDLEAALVKGAPFFEALAKLGKDLT